MPAQNCSVTVELGLHRHVDKASQKFPHVEPNTHYLNDVFQMQRRWHSNRTCGKVLADSWTGTCTICSQKPLRKKLQRGTKLVTSTILSNSGALAPQQKRATNLATSGTRTCTVCSQLLPETSCPCGANITPHVTFLNQMHRNHRRSDLHILLTNLPGQNPLQRVLPKSEALAHRRFTLRSVCGAKLATSTFSFKISSLRFNLLVELITLITKSVDIVRNVSTFRHQLIEGCGITLLILLQDTLLFVLPLSSCTPTTQACYGRDRQSLP